MLTGIIAFYIVFGCMYALAASDYEVIEPDMDLAGRWIHLLDTVATIGTWTYLVFSILIGIHVANLPEEESNEE